MCACVCVCKCMSEWVRETIHRFFGKRNFKMYTQFGERQVAFWEEKRVDAEDAQTIISFVNVLR